MLLNWQRLKEDTDQITTGASVRVKRTAREALRLAKYDTRSSTNAVVSAHSDSGGNHCAGLTC